MHGHKRNTSLQWEGLGVGGSQGCPHLSEPVCWLANEQAGSESPASPLVG